MENLENLGFATKQIHAGKVKNAAGALSMPIYQTSTFVFDSVEQGGRRFAGAEEGYIYSRLGNPTVNMVEEKVAALEGGEAGACTSSGMGAISAALWSATKAGDEILASDTLYGCTYSLLSEGMSKFGVKTTFIDFSDIDLVKKSLNEKVTVVYFETPCNPTMKIVDIEEVAKAVHEYNKDIVVMMDNTFASPYLQQPISLGVDVVVHSATKYLNGHGDIVAGVVVGKKDYIKKVKGFGIKDMTGTVMSPFDAYLMARGLKTLDIRMEKHCLNAMYVAKFLEGHKAVKKVYYPGLESFEGYEIAKKQMKLPGGMISIELNANRDDTAKVINDLKLATVAVSLGDAETLVEHPASMTHSMISKEELEKSGIAEGLVRISIGLEDKEDIVADFKQAFDKLL